MDFILNVMSYDEQYKDILGYDVSEELSKLGDDPRIIKDFERLVQSGK